MKVPNFLKLCAFFTLTCELQALPPPDPPQCGNVNCQDGEVCKRVGGQPMCVGPSDGTCSIGGPNHKTFDGLRYDFKGSCTYTVAKTCGNNNNNQPAFHIKAKYGNYGNNQDSSFNNVSVEIAYPDQKYVLNMARVGNVKVNGNSRRGDLNLGDKIQTIQSGVNVILATDFELTVTYDSDPIMKVNGNSRRKDLNLGKKVNIYQSGVDVNIETDFGLTVTYHSDPIMKVSLPSSFSQEVSGMCGNNNKDPTDDFATTSGTPTPTSPADFGKTWKVNDGENSPRND